MPTIQQVAKVAGVSVATVSRVINNSGRVVDKTREKVEKAIADLNYSPNMIGRNLRRKTTEVILVLLPNISNPFYAKTVSGITSVAKKNGFTVMVCSTNSDKNLELNFLNLLKYKLADGAILMSQEMTNGELSKFGQSYSIVQCSEYVEAQGVPYVTIDNSSAAFDAVSHLISLGHERIGLISSKGGYFSAAQRQEGYVKALQNAKIKFDMSLVKFGDYGYRSGMACAEQFLQMNTPPTAVFSISDPMAIGAMKKFQKSGLRVPDDIAMVGFDNVSFSQMCEPELTTISQPTYKMGCKAMDILLMKIENKSKVPEKTILNYNLIIRGSTVIN